MSFRYDISGAQSPYARIVEDALINVTETALDSTMRAKKAEGNGIKQVNPYLLLVQRSQSSKLKTHMKKKTGVSTQVRLETRTRLKTKAN